MQATALISLMLLAASSVEAVNLVELNSATENKLNADLSAGTFGENNVGKKCGKGYHGFGCCVCNKCDRGKYQDQSNYQGQTCSKCPMGKYQEDRGKSSCTKCSMGKYNNQTGRKTEDECHNCPGGYYMPDPGASLCLACDVGKYSVQTRLDSGEYQNTKCQECGKGGYAGTTGTASCDKCPAGRHCGSKGKTSVDDCTVVCPVGKFAKSGDDYCTPCAKYYYNDKTEQSSCKKCPGGKKTLATGSTSESDCV